jgi:hypothetical protein
MMHMTNNFFFCLLCLFVSYVVVLLGILHLGYPVCEILASTNLLITSYRYNMRLNYLNDCRRAHCAFAGIYQSQ